MSTAFRVGVLVVMALVFLSIGVFLIGNKDFLFSSTYRLKAEFQNVTGLNNGAAVRIGGIHQGTVKEIDLPSQPDGKVTVVMWTGEARITRGAGETTELVQTEAASYKLDGLILVIEGIGRAKSCVAPVLQAFGVTSYEDETKTYCMRAFMIVASLRQT